MDDDNLMMPADCTGPIGVLSILSIVQIQTLVFLAVLGFVEVSFNPRHCMTEPN